MIIPFFDPPLQFFEEAVASVHAQSFRDWELLLVDDGSKSTASMFAKEHARAHPGRVCYLEFDGHAHRGLAAARNLGLRRARGEFVAPLDADDVWHTHKLEHQATILTSAKDVGWVYGRTLVWYAWTGRPVDQRRDYLQPHLLKGRGSLAVNGRVDQPGLLLPYVRAQFKTPSMSNLMFRRAVAVTCGGAEESFQLWEDFAFVSKLALAAPAIISDECWDRYRQHPDSMCARAASVRTWWRVRAQFAHWLAQYVERVCVNNPALVRAVRRERYYGQVRWIASRLAKRLASMLPTRRPA